MPNGFLHLCFLLLRIFNYKATYRSHLRISKRKTRNPNWTGEPNHHISSLTWKFNEKYNVKKRSGYIYYKIFARQLRPWNEVRNSKMCLQTNVVRKKNPCHISHNFLLTVICPQVGKISCNGQHFFFFTKIIY